MLTFEAPPGFFESGCCREKDIILFFYVTVFLLRFLLLAGALAAA